MVLGRPSPERPRSHESMIFDGVRALEGHEASTSLLRQLVKDFGFSEEETRGFRDVFVSRADHNCAAGGGAVESEHAWGAQHVVRLVDPHGREAYSICELQRVQ